MSKQLQNGKPIKLGRRQLCSVTQGQRCGSKLPRVSSVGLYLMFAATSVETALLAPGICFSHAGLFPAANTPPTYQTIWDQKCLIYLLIPSNEKVTGCVTSVPEQTEIQILKRKSSSEFRHRSFCSWWYLKKVTELKPPFTQWKDQITSSVKHGMDIPF